MNDPARFQSDEAEEALPRFSDDAQGYYQKSLALFQLGDYPDAHQAIEQSLNLNPTDVAALKLKGAILEAMLGLLDQVIQNRPKDPAAWFGKSIALLQLNRQLEALDAVKRVLAIDPQHAAAMKLQCALLTALSQTIDEGCQDNPETTAICTAKAGILRDTGHYEEALVMYDQAINSDPDYAPAHFYKGMTLGQLQRHEEAVAEYDQAMRLYPAHVDVCKFKCMSLMALKRFPEAFTTIDYASRLEPSNPGVLTLKGSLLFKQERYQEALALMERVLTLESVDPLIRDTALKGKHIIQEALDTL